MNLIFMINHSKLLHISKVDYFQIEAQVCYAFHYNFQKFSDNWRRISINWWQHIFLAGCIPEPSYRHAPGLNLWQPGAGDVKPLAGLLPAHAAPRGQAKGQTVTIEVTGFIRGQWKCKRFSMQRLARSKCLLTALLRSDLGLSGTRVSGSRVCTGR